MCHRIIKMLSLFAFSASVSAQATDRVCITSRVNDYQDKIKLELELAKKEGAAVLLPGEEELHGLLDSALAGLVCLSAVDVVDVVALQAV